MIPVLEVILILEKWLIFWMGMQEGGEERRRGEERGGEGRGEAERGGGRENRRERERRRGEAGKELFSNI